MQVFQNFCVLEWQEAKHPDAEGSCLRSVFVLSVGEEHMVQYEDTENS